MMWGSNENEWVDYSPANTNYFREWLKNKYKNDESLKKAWNNNDVTIDTAEIPTYKERANANFGMMRNPENEMNVIDFYQYNSWLVADTIKVFTKAVKDATKRRKTVGIFYGYLSALRRAQQQNSGHNALVGVLASGHRLHLLANLLLLQATRRKGTYPPCRSSTQSSYTENSGLTKTRRTSLSQASSGLGQARNVDGDIISKTKSRAYSQTESSVVVRRRIKPI